MSIQTQMTTIWSQCPTFPPYKLSMHQVHLGGGVAGEDEVGVDEDKAVLRVDEIAGEGLREATLAVGDSGRFCVQFVA